MPSPAIDNGFGITTSVNQKWYGLARGTNLTSLAGPTPFPISSDMVALELQDPTIATPVSRSGPFANATGNGADRRKTYTCS